MAELVEHIRLQMDRPLFITLVAVVVELLNMDHLLLIPDKEDQVVVVEVGITLADHTLSLLLEQPIQVEVVAVAEMMAVGRLVDQVWLSYTMEPLEQHLLLVPHLTP